MPADLLKHSIKLFAGFLSLERGLAPATVSAYCRDLEQAADFLDSIGVRSWTEVGREHLYDVLDDLRIRGFESSSIARHLVAIKVFFRYLVSEQVIKENITEVE